jgi:hypothetical protein
MVTVQHRCRVVVFTCIIQQVNRCCYMTQGSSQNFVQRIQLDRAERNSYRHIALGCDCTAYTTTAAVSTVQSANIQYFDTTCVRMRNQLRHCGLFMCAYTKKLT